jgi:hypothetical protein
MGDLSGNENENPNLIFCCKNPNLIFYKKIYFKNKKIYFKNKKIKKIYFL